MTLIQGTVKSLMEEDGIVTGILYQAGDIEVVCRRRGEEEGGQGRGRY